MDQSGSHLLTTFTCKMSWSNSYGLAMAGGWKSVKLRTLLHVLGNCLNNVKFYFGNKHHFWIDQPLFFHLYIMFNKRYGICLELSAVTKEVAQVLLNGFFPADGLSVHDVTASFQRTAYQCMTLYAASLPIVLRHPLNSGIALAIYLAFHSQYVQILLRALLCKLTRSAVELRYLSSEGTNNYKLLHILLLTNPFAPSYNIFNVKNECCDNIEEAVLPDEFMNVTWKCRIDWCVSDLMR
jgi:hypothetical protein